MPVRSSSLVKTLHAFRRLATNWPNFLATESEYFARNAERMRYPKFRADHLFIGSGVIEAGCKTVIGSRLKKSGMFWTVRGANSHHRSPMQPAQRQNFRTTGNPGGRHDLFHKYVAHPPRNCPQH